MTVLYLSLLFWSNKPNFSDVNFQLINFFSIFSSFPGTSGSVIGVWIVFFAAAVFASDHHRT